MRDVIVSEFLSVDGVMEAPEEWSLQFFGDDIGRYKDEELFASDALLLGRVTYEGFAEAWPSRSDETGFADRINSLPKYVVSRTLADPAWNNSRIIDGDLADEVAQLKQQPGQDILVNGSADLVDALMRYDLVDEYRLMIFPIVVGSGKRLFEEDSEKHILRLADTESFQSGVTVLTYRPENGSPTGEND